MRLQDAVDYYTKMLDEDPNNDIWFAFRGWRASEPANVRNA